MPPTLADRVIHILNAIEDVEKILQGKEQREFAEDRVLRMAVERLLEIISEASRFIPPEAKARANQISWQNIADLGNWLRHAYHRIDATILWNIYQDDLPPLKAFVEQVLRDEKRG